MGVNLVQLKRLTRATQVTYFHSRQRNEALRNEKLFAALIATPFDFGTIGRPGSSNPLTAPGSGRLAIAHSAGTAAADLTVFIGPNRTTVVPILTAGEIFKAEYVERGQIITFDVAAGAAVGTVTIYLVKTFGPAVPIGTATVI